MTRAALYLRLSKEDQVKNQPEEPSESIKNQRLLLLEYASCQNFHVEDIYIDDDYSGLYDDRPGFRRLIQDCRAGKIDVVVAKSQSRFTRNMSHVEQYLHHDFPLLGIRFIGVVDGVDTNIKSNKKARQIYGLTNEWYCEDLSENIRTVLKRKMKAGQFLGSSAPYGYQKDSRDHHKLVPDPLSAPVVKKIYQLYYEGCSIDHICAILKEEKIMNPSSYQMFLTKKEMTPVYSWSKTTVKRILSNETYTGKLIQGTCERINYKTKKTRPLPKEQWIVIENHHEPIVSPAFFSKISSLRKQRRLVTPEEIKSGKTHLFSGKLYCSSCHAFMVKSGHVRNHPDDWYLRCSLANRSRNQECTSHNIRFTEVYSAIKKELYSHMKLDPLPTLNHALINDFIEKITVAQKDNRSTQILKIYWNF